MFFQCCRSMTWRKHRVLLQLTTRCCICNPRSMKTPPLPPCRLSIASSTTRCRRSDTSARYVVIPATPAMWLATSEHTPESDRTRVPCVARAFRYAATWLNTLYACIQVTTRNSEVVACFMQPAIDVLLIYEIIIQLLKPRYKKKVVLRILIVQFKVVDVLLKSNSFRWLSKILVSTSNHCHIWTKSYVR